jgi:hypothetical protein
VQAAAVKTPRRFVLWKWVEGEEMLGPSKREGAGLLDPVLSFVVDILPGSYFFPFDLVLDPNVLLRVATPP